MAYEEIGKSILADRQLDRACGNPGAEESARNDLLELIKRHQTKQGWAVFDTGCETPEKYRDLDTQKQRALYVEYSKDNVTSPSISSEKLRDFLKKVFRALNEIGDLPYSRVSYVSTDKSQWQANRDVESVRGIYEEVVDL